MFPILFADNVNTIIQDRGADYTLFHLDLKMKQFLLMLQKSIMKIWDPRVLLALKEGSGLKFIYSEKASQK